MESNKTVQTLIAIDISKKNLEVIIDAQRTSSTVPYTEEGMKKLLTQIKRVSNPWIICEATGGYERPLLSKLHASGITVSLVSPRRVREFIRSEGVKCKTDAIDAKMLLGLAQEKKGKLRVTPVPEPEKEILAALTDRRHHLVEERKKEKTRLKNSSAVIHESIKDNVKWLDQQIAKLDKQIEETIASSPSLTVQYEAICKVKGVGSETARCLLAYLPDVTNLTRSEVAALVGVAPFNDDSGDKTGRRRISGGNKKVRRVLYMAATSAAQYNEVIRDYFNRLIAAGRPHKWAMVAAMRKLLVHIHSLLKNLEIPSKALA